MSQHLKSQCKVNETENRKLEILETFHLLDPTCTGAIPATSLLIALRLFDLTPTSLALERAAKEDRLAQPEFITIMDQYSKSQRDWCREECKEIFNLFDKKQDGVITVPHIRRYLGRINEILTYEEIEAETADYFRKITGKMDLLDFEDMVLS